MQAAELRIRAIPRPGQVRSAMAGFFLLGCLVALLGALLPVWAYYVPFDLATAGDYFLALNLGIFAASMLARDLLNRLGLRLLLVFTCLLASVTILVLALVTSPQVLIFPFIFLGFATGLLTTGVSWLTFDVMSAPMASAVLSLAGVFFGSGAVGFVALIWATVHVLSAPKILALTTLPPLVLSLLYLRQRSLAQPALQTSPVRISLRATGTPVSLLLTLALFFQSGSEWACGGWLAIHWIRRLGVRMETALLGLMLYWIVLTLAKVALPRFPWLATPFRQATASTAAALFGCMLLFSTVGVGGAAVGVVLLAAGLGSTNPLILSTIGERFPHYHPGFFNGLLSLALIGGMLAPWSVGRLANDSVIQWMLVVPAGGAVMVYLLLSLVLLEARVARMSKTASSS